MRTFTFVYSFFHPGLTYSYQFWNSSFENLHPHVLIRKLRKKHLLDHWQMFQFDQFTFSTFLSPL